MIKLKSLLTEILGNKNFWMTPGGSIEDTGDNHIIWLIDNIPLGFDFSGEDGLPIKDDGSITDENEVYEETYKLGYIRMVKYNDEILFMYSSSKPPTNIQMRELKDFAIEHGWGLYDSLGRREIEL